MQGIDPPWMWKRRPKPPVYPCAVQCCEEDGLHVMMQALPAAPEVAGAMFKPHKFFLCSEDHARFGSGETLLLDQTRFVDLQFDT